jgi:hypothetical protein
VSDLSPFPVAERQLVYEAEVAPEDQRCGAQATTANVFGTRVVTCAQPARHVGKHASKARRAFPRLAQFWVYAWR